MPTLNRRQSQRPVTFRPQLDQLEERSNPSVPTPDPMLIDIRPGPGGSSPSQFTAVGGVTFFVANDGSSGRELWKSDGTAAGTVLVKDINPGSGSSHPGYLTNVNGTLFFRANDGSSGYELWKSDGTAAGTVLVKDINPGSGSSHPGYLTNVNGTLFFRAFNGISGYELWKSDGTEPGTVLVKDINPGSGSSHPGYLTNVNGTLFFQAFEIISGLELWKSDGTESGTVRVKDINPGGSSDPSSLTNVNGTLFFRATDGSSGEELWKSDGTEAGTVRVKDIIPGFGGSYPSFLTNVNGTLFFRAFDGSSGEELWKSDGTEPGTVRVKDINPGFSSSDPRYLTNVNGTLFFRANDGSSGFELWKSDGTEPGTVRVKDINPGFSSSFPSFLTNVNGTLFFRATDGSSGEELWKSDGTEPGTVRVKDINPGSGSSSPASLTNVNGTLFFSANDGSSGFELWVMDLFEAAPTITGIGPDSGIPSDGITNTPALTVLGTANPNVLVTLFLNGFAVGYATADSTGLWSIAHSLTLDGLYSFSATATDKSGNVSALATPFTVRLDRTGVIPQVPEDRIAVAPLSGSSKTNLNPQTLDVYSPSGSKLFSIGTGWRVGDGIRIASGDVTGDGIADIVATPLRGSGRGTIKIYDGLTGLLVRQVTPLTTKAAPSIAVGDVNGDGFGDLLATAQGRVTAWSGATGLALLDWPAIKGVTITGIAAGDVTGDGKAEVLLQTTKSAMTTVAAFQATSVQGPAVTLYSTPGLTKAAQVAAGDVDGDGFADVILSTTGKNPQVTIINGKDATTVLGQFAAPGGKAGKPLNVLDHNGDGKVSLLFGAVKGVAQSVILTDVTGTPVVGFTPLDPFGTGFLGGIEV